MRQLAPPPSHCVRCLRRGKVSRREYAAGKHGNVHCPEEIQPQSKRSGVGIRPGRRTVEVHVAGRPASAQECVLGITGGHHAGQSFEPLLQLPVELDRLAVFVSRQAGVNSEEQNVLRIETRIECLQLMQGTHQQPGADQYHYRERNLRHNRRVAKPRTQAALRCATRDGRCILPQRWCKVSARAGEAGGKTTQDACGDGNAAGKRKHTPVRGNDKRKGPIGRWRSSW